MECFLFGDAASLYNIRLDVKVLEDTRSAIDRLADLSLPWPWHVHHAWGPGGTAQVGGNLIKHVRGDSRLHVTLGLPASWNGKRIQVHMRPKLAT